MRALCARTSVVVADQDAAALVHINTLLIQRILAEPAWAARLGDADRRGLSPLSWSHVRLFGTFRLDMDTHLDLDRGPTQAEAA